MTAQKYERNDPRQYDDMATEWWRPDGKFAALHWLARARGALVPPPPRENARLLDIGCGGGLLAPHVRGYRHVGVDISARALEIAAAHGVEPVESDAAALPFADATFDVVVAGEVLEHVEDLEGTVREALRVLKPGGTFVCDTIADTRRARIALITIGERMPGGPPPGCHDPRLFVDPRRLEALCAREGVILRLNGLRPDARELIGFLIGHRRSVRFVPTRSVAVLYQGVGTKAQPPSVSA